jgi:hypothetical protein
MKGEISIQERIFEPSDIGALGAIDLMWENLRVSGIEIFEVRSISNY